jgi:hypothetical protein
LADQLRSETLGDEPKGNFLTQELQQAIVAVTAFAFAFDGFYDVVRHELGQHPDAGIWRTNRTARHKQITETLRYHLKLGPKFTAHLRSFVEELLNFRGRAVHPSSRFVEAAWRPDIDCGVHPQFITFSGPLQYRPEPLRSRCLIGSSTAPENSPNQIRKRVGSTQAVQCLTALAGSAESPGTTS